jgi:hypothetical protein
MGRPIFVVLALTLLFENSALRCESQTLTPVRAAPDHIGIEGSVQDQARYLIGQWPRDFEIAVVEALEEPTCNRPTKADCSVQVKPVEVVLGHQPKASYVVSYRRGKEADGGARIEVKQGDRIVAMLTPVIHPPNKPVAYIATYLDHANDAIVESIRNAVAEILTAGARCERKP